MSDSPEYNLIRTKRRSIALIVERDGSLTVRAPRRAALRDIERFIHEKLDWVLQTRKKLESSIVIPEKRYENGEFFLFLGRNYPLQIVKSQRPALKFDNAFLLGSTARVRGQKVFTRWYQQQAFTLISARVNRYAAEYGFTPGKVGISSAKTRWGSCSSKGNLTFTWRLIMAPLDVVDYVVLHELAHLRIKNHSKNFWALVESICPSYYSHRKWLRQNGERLSF